MQCPELTDLTVDEGRAIAFWLHCLVQLQSIKEIHAEYAGLD